MGTPESDALGRGVVATSIADEVRAVAGRARTAAAQLAVLHRDAKDEALHSLADALIKATPQIVNANAADVARAHGAEMSEALIDRLTLDGPRLAAVADAVRDIAELDDPIGDVVRGYTLANGLEVRQIRVPLGVIGMVYEARPNVTVDAAALALKSGNAALLRGSSSAYNTNVALVEVMRDALRHSSVPVDAIQLVPGKTHDSVAALMTARGLVDVIIPRGGAELINSVVTGSTVPVIETGSGNCHVYVDADADIDKACEILLNSKVARPSVCNAAETLLVHADIADEFLSVALPALDAAGVTVHGDSVVAAAGQAAGVTIEPVTDEDWAAEYYSLDIAAGVVASLGGAIDHIRRWSSGHTEAIVTESLSCAARFAAEVDSAAVMINASTRFTDGAEFGFGAEIGISTQKLHARGPMGLRELTTTKYVVTGSGQIRH